MGLRSYLPFQRQALEAPTKTVVITAPEQQKKMAKMMKASTLALGIFPGYGTRSNFEESPYDFDKIIQAIDTDSYVKQAFLKYKEVFWKGGWDIVGENHEAVEYIYQRIDFMEMAMKKPFQSFLELAQDQMIKFFNVFLVKSRGDLNSFFPERLKPVGKNDEPIVGYEIIPVETVRIGRNRWNKPLKYTQETGGGWGTASGPPEWDADQVIQISLDQKPGHLFGTPFMTAVMDDVISLRQIEEDVQNLVHQELFPFYSVTVGTETEPADEPEIIQAAEEIASMRTEGAMVHSERRKIDVVGADGAALQADPYMDRFLSRVCAGLGLSPHHLGLMMNGGNRSVTDRLDIALYDKVKSFQRIFAEHIRLMVINELLFEGGFNPILRREDRVTFRFREIDMDTLIKVETHIVNLYSNDLLSSEEARLRLRITEPLDESDTRSAMQARLAPDQVVTPKTADGKPAAPQTVDTTPATAKKGDAATPSKGGKPNPKNNSRGTGNAVRPQNQHGRRSSPNVRHDVTLDDIVELLDNNEELG